ncbi:hypothetical protein CK934_09110 [Chitinophaga sp. MD30]|nr:hypothetical protein CK934_09110 [Chitinophaga sp. MD30]
MLVLLAAASLAISVHSCKKQDQAPQPNLSKLSVASARTFFETQVKKGGVRTEDANKLPIGEPNWDSAYDKKLNIGDAIAAPLKMKSYHKTGSVEVQGDNYLLVYKTKYGNLRHEIVTVIPATAHEGVATFNGATIVRDWSGKILRSFIYKNGSYDAATTTIGRSAATEKEGVCFQTSSTVCFPLADMLGQYCEYGVQTNICYGGGGDSGGGGDIPGNNPDPGNYPNPGGGSGGGTNQPNQPAEPEGTGTDCASFDFVATTPLWQEAGVHNVKVRWVFYGMYGTLDKEFYPDNFVFGLPTAYGNGKVITPAMAAVMSAEALDKAKSAIFRKFAHEPYLPADAIVIEAFRTLVHEEMAKIGGTCGQSGSKSPNIRFKDEVRSFFGSRNCN